MARIGYADPDDLTGELKDWYDRLPPNPRMFLTLALAPGTADLFMKLGTAIHDTLELPERLVEIDAAVVTQVAGSAYLLKRHHPPANTLTTVERNALLAGAGPDDIESFDDRDRAVHRFVKALIDSPRVDDTTFADAQLELSDRELVELIQTHGYYWMLAQLDCTLRLADNP
ncbi:carboxymuconolactone decarboxylase family protein [Kribbella sp. NPDC056345]|uniref:carboxymuconolactone decarboxylase family protein n=1 Tax=Kribbella sp. NPDC056345 TaxID=3345789 RepID=UPI0035DC7C54